MVQDFSQYLDGEFEDHLQLAAQTLAQCGDSLRQATSLISTCLQQNHKVLLFGNGGSAADAQHLAAELSGRFRRERRALPAIALTTDTSALTAISNDYGFEQVFARQVAGLAQAGDVVIGISTSGTSPNVLAGIREAGKRGCQTLALTGKGGSPLASMADVSICIPSSNTARIQEMHILVAHILCGWIENNL